MKELSKITVCLKCRYFVSTTKGKKFKLPVEWMKGGGVLRSYSLLPPLLEIRLPYYIAMLNIRITSIRFLETVGLSLLSSWICDL